MDNTDAKPNLTEEEKAKKYADRFGLSFVRLTGKEIPYDIISIIPEHVAKEFEILVYEKAAGTPETLKIAVADPERLKKKAPEVLSELKKEKGINFELAITTLDDFHYGLKFYQKSEEKEVPTLRQDVGGTGSRPEPVSPSQGGGVGKEGHVQKNGKYPLVDLAGMKISQDVLNKFPKEVAEKYQMIVFEALSNGNAIKVALVDPENPEASEILNFIKDRNNLEIEKFQTSVIDFRKAIKLYGEPVIKEEKAIDEKIIAKPKVEAEPIKEEKTVLAEHAPEVKQEEVKSDEPETKKGEEPIIKPVGLAEDAEEKNLDNFLPGGIRNTEDLTKIIKTGFIPKIVAGMIYLAVKSEASDIHIEAEEKEMRLRYRIDGILKDIMKMPLSLHPPIISRIKILARLKIDEQRIPQDGRIDVTVAKREIDLRISTLPTIHGEKVVMRVLDKSSGIYTLEKLGFSGINLARVEKSMKAPYGIILATGPTGSGKSTSLYAILETISTPEVNVVTLEDPVEYELQGINQCQIKPKIGFGFAEGLRSVVRQDPNIIMVGEIRDTETADLATHAALTGHLVLSTLHTNDAAGALPRLINMGVEPFLITSSINVIMAQRLVRRICSSCKQEQKVPEPTIKEIQENIAKAGSKELEVYKDKPLKFYEGKGCAECGGDGYKGRIGLYEVLEMSEKIEDLAVRKMPASEIQKQAILEGMITMKQDGIMKALQGLTTLDEVFRVTAN